MMWQTALDVARSQTDITYEEWCDLYVSHPTPHPVQVEHALKVARPILVRNGVIQEDVVLSYGR